MAQLIVIAARSLLQHKRRTLLLAGAIGGVTCLLVLMVSLSGGIHATMLESATTLMSGHLNVGGFYKVTSGQSAPAVTHYEQVLEVVKKEIPELAFVTHRGRGWAKLVSETGSQQAGVGSIDIDHEPTFRRVIQLKEGALDGLREPNTILLFEEQAKKLGVKVGDVLTIAGFSLRGVSNTADVRVVAVAKSVGLMSSWNTFVSHETLRRIYQYNDHTTGALLLYLKDLKDVPKVEEKLRKALKAAGYPLMEKDPQAFWMKFESVNREDWTGQKLDVTTWEDEISFMTWILKALSALTFVLTFVLLLIIAVGIMNTLWISIRERTREIGTLRAIGMQRGRVLAMFVVETLLLAFAGSLVGAALGLVLCQVGNAAHLSVSEGLRLFIMRDTLVLKASPAVVGLAIGLITFCTTLVSLIPSYLAARMKPVTAMHHVG